MSEQIIDYLTPKLPRRAMTETVTASEYNLIQRIRQCKHDGLLHIRVEAAQPKTLTFIVDAKVETL